ncbi:MAG: hypothetical protein UIV44_07065 [Bacteroidales bacterium]
MASVCEIYFYVRMTFYEPLGKYRKHCIAVEIEYKLDTPVEKNLYDYITSANV